MNYDVHIYTDGAAKGNPGREDKWSSYESVKIKPTAKNFMKGLG
jgi:ribonuclease HI